MSTKRTCDSRFDAIQYPTMKTPCLRIRWTFDDNRSVGIVTDPSFTGNWFSLEKDFERENGLGVNILPSFVCRDVVSQDGRGYIARRRPEAPPRGNATVTIAHGKYISSFPFTPPPLVVDWRYCTGHAQTGRKTLVESPPNPFWQ